MSPLQKLLPILSCPDDAGSLRHQGDSLQCALCGAHYPVLASNLVELLPSAEALQPDSSPYAADYHSERTRGFSFRADAVAWGAPEYRSGPWVERKRRQVEVVRPLLADGAGPREVLCDFSAGAGYYTFAYAPEWRHVVHLRPFGGRADLCASQSRAHGTAQHPLCPDGLSASAVSGNAQSCHMPR